MKEIHLASSIESLNAIAQRNIKNIKAEKLYNSAEKLFKIGLENQNLGDEEMAYIHYHRFISIYEFLETKSEDKNFPRLRLGSEYRTVSDQIEKLKISLHNRYLELEQKSVPPVNNFYEEPKKLIEKPQHLSTKFTNGFITCGDVYQLLQTKRDIIFFDTRTHEEYQKSRLRYPYAINIPGEIIQSGKSANILGKDVPNESKFQWDRRWSAELLILFDWSSTKDNMIGSKVNILKEILISWDGTIEANNQPLILLGGYMEFLQLYPMLCTYPDVFYSIQNDVLNELLDLDSIEYPAPEEAVRYLKPPSLQPVINRATKPITYQNVPSPHIELDLNKIEYDPDDEDEEGRMVEEEEEISKETEQDMKSGEKDQESEKITEKKDDGKVTEKISERKSKPDLNKENEEIRKKIQNFEVNDNKKNDMDLRERLLQDARATKKDIESRLLRKDPVPIINRSTKPVNDVGKVVIPGYTGIKNLGVTCYMNAILQVLSNTRILYDYFVSNADFVVDTPVSKPFKNLLLKLWSGRCYSITPTNFKAVVNAYGPRFNSGEHQDAQEFFISLTSWLHDELKTDIQRHIQNVYTPKEQAWIDETDGKVSIVQDAFTGQHLNVIDCENCTGKLKKYELFQNLTLALPKRKCTLEECLDMYLRRHEISDYRCNKCNQCKNVFMSHDFATLPPNLVITLKRFNFYNFKNGDLKIEKNCSHVDYPVSNLNISGMKYDLYGVVIHRGQINLGHYVAIVRNLYTGKWVMYDDSNVTPMSIDEGPEPQNAYMLFYTLAGENKKKKPNFKI